MQNRMKEFPMTETAIKALLDRAQSGALSTIGADGFPYTVPVHFLALDGCIYLHGLPVGEKLSNLAACPKVCFTVWVLNRLLDEGLKTVCSVDADYESVVIRGTAEVLTDPAEKTRVLKALVMKYIPHLQELPMPDARVQGTAVIRITPVSCTGKYHK